MNSNVVCVIRVCGNCFAYAHGRARFVRKGECRLDQRPVLELLVECNAKAEHVEG